MFGVEESEEREQKRRRMSGADNADPGGAQDREEEELERSGVFDDDPGGAQDREEEEFESSGVFDDEPRVEPGARGRGRAGVVVPEEEGRSIRTPAPPYVPSVKERREHNVTHYPPRSWCRHCVAGRGLASPHCRGDSDEPGNVGELHFDYCFLRNKASEESATTLVGVDRHTQGVLAHVVPSKGTDETGFSVDSLVEGVKWFDYSKLMLKSDNEPAMVKLLSEALRELTIQEVLQVLGEHLQSMIPKRTGRQKSV